MLYLEHIKAKKITVKLLKIKGHILSGTQLTVKKQDFASPCNINNFDGIEYSRG